jgi:hypothetical protein
MQNSSLFDDWISSYYLLDYKGSWARGGHSIQKLF